MNKDISQESNSSEDSSFSEDQVHKEKVVIIGGGPAGLTAAIYAARAGLNPVIAIGDFVPETMPGGQLMITTDVENFPGFKDGIEGPDLIENMMEQATKFGTRMVSGFANSFELLKPNGPFRFNIGPELYEADCIICANGASAKWLNLENEEKFRNRGISACATCDGPLPVFRNKHICVVGGGDSAIEEASFLTKFASKVTIIHRRDELRASKIMQKRAMDNPKIDFRWNSVITEYLGDDHLTAIRLKNVKTEEEDVVETPGVFMAIGHKPNTDSLKGSGIELDETGYIKVNNQVFTNIPGVFACGDVHDTVYRQAITAAGFGCMAAISAERWLEENH